MEAAAAESAGAVIHAEEDGVVTFADASVVRIKPNKRGAKEKEYHPEKFVQSNMDTCYNQRVLVETGHRKSKRVGRLSKALLARTASWLWVPTLRWPT